MENAPSDTTTTEAAGTFTPPHPLLGRLFTLCETLGASDIHLGAGEVPRLRVQGVLRRAEDFGPTPPDEAEAIALSLVATCLPPGVSAADAARSRLDATGAVDGAVSSPAGHRYRVNVFRSGGASAAALRRLDDRFQTLAELGLPERLADFTLCPHGLVVVTGPTGSGKSTTLATLIDIINRTRDGHIITIEDPVEYLHPSQRCLVRQRQIGRDAPDFHAALVEALRQDPDVILVGEVREIETIRTAITAAETGHLVFTTLHAGDCVGAIERLVSVFPAGEQDSIRRQLSLVLRGVFAQHLLPAASPGARRVACGELMFATPAIANLIATGRSQQIYSAIELGAGAGMRTLSQALDELVRSGRITPAQRLSAPLAK